MLKWISELASPRSDSIEDQRKQLGDQDDSLMVDLVVSEVEQQVQEFETLQERRRSECSQGRPDYSWLITDPNLRPRKYLTPSERSRVEAACERMKPAEWSELINMWKSRSKNVESRQQIFDIFLTAAAEVISRRPRDTSASEVLRKYVRSGSSINAVSDSPRVADSLDSARSLNDITFRDFHDLV